MPVDSLSAARRICARGGWSISNLQLQKILYLAHMIFVGQNNGQRLINRRFEAWDYGPVEPESYRKAAIFGRKPIQDIFLSAPDITGSEEAEAIDTIAGQLLLKTPGELVAITHWEGGAWAKNYIPGAKGVPIPEADILDEFAARSIRAAAAVSARANSTKSSSLC